jgi:DNA-binding Xre family transcriptional regulator
MVLRTLTENYDGGLKKLAQDIGMSEANLHRCINNNKIQASDLEQIAIKLNVDVRTFFENEAIKNDSQEVDLLKSENVALKAELKRVKELKLPTRDSKIYNLWMKFMEITEEMQELYKEEKGE